MKAAGILVVAAAVLAACGAMYDESGVQQGGDMLSGQTLKTSESALTAKDCSVSIQCADGTSRSCSGTAGACSASGAGDGSVTCNGATYTCPSAPPPCGADGYCDPACGSDPDCGDYCVGGKYCTKNYDCGIDGLCSNGRCLCY